MSAVQSPVSEEESMIGSPFPLSTQPKVLDDILAGTQTAMAVNALPTPTVIIILPEASEEPSQEAPPAAEVVKDPTEEPQEVAPTPEPQISGTSEDPDFEVFEGYGPGFPTFGIRGVLQNESVTIQANDFPENTSYSVIMMPYSNTAGNGIHVGNFTTENPEKYFQTFDIPSDLYGSNQIAIRIEFSTGRWASNWFHNSTTQ